MKQLDAGVEDVWFLLVDWERQARWMGDADWVRVEGPREGVGVSLSVKTRIYNIPAFTERLEVIEWGPPSRLVIAHRSLVEGTGTWTLEPSGDGCRFTWTEDVTLPVVRDLVAGIYRPFLAKMMEASMARLADMIAPKG